MIFVLIAIGNENQWLAWVRTEARCGGKAVCAVWIREGFAEFVRERVRALRGLW